MTHSGPRRRALWGLKRARSLAKGQLATGTKTEPSGVGLTTPSHHHIGYRWGTRLRKLNTKLMGGHLTKRQLGRKRSVTQSMLDTTNASEGNEHSSYKVGYSKLPTSPSSIFQSNLSGSPHLLDHSGSVKEESPKNVITNFTRSISLATAETTSSGLFYYRRGSFPSLTRFFRSNSLLNQLDDEVTPTAESPLTATSSRFSLSHFAKGLFLGGTESGVPITLNPKEILEADLGNAVETS